MRSPTPAPATAPPSDGVHRRMFGLGLAGMALDGSFAAPAQSPWQDSEDLFRNLLTRMSLRVDLNGRGGSIFVVDTGAGRSAISQDLAQALRLPSGPPVLVHGITAAAVAPTVRLARLGVGGRRFDDLVIPVFPRQALAADGLLGLDVLSRFELAFDLRRREVRLKPSGPDVITVSQSHAMPSRLSRTAPARARSGRFGQMILTNSRAGDVEIEAFVDSGAQYSIGNTALRRSAGLALTDDGRAPPVTVHGVTGQSMLARSGRARDLRVARQDLGTTPLLFADLHAFRALDLVDRPALLIGADILYRFRRVTLDFGRSRMVFSGLARRRPPPA